MQENYNPHFIESNVQKKWSDLNIFHAEDSNDKEKYFCLSMFPYPSGRLHMGHVRNYTIGDVISRFQRMQGKNVLQPMGWDAFGLPAENAAMQNHVHPSDWTFSNIDYMRNQLKRLGFAYDWTREIATCSPDYYHWEQWFFLRLLEKDLVYKKTAPVNWCPNDLTVLANEQVIDGCCWRCDTKVERKEIAQWFLRITDYAQELLDSLDTLDGWPEQVKTMQANWIGRSEGVEIDFQIPEYDSSIRIYTTRPDTLMGVTYLAVAAEHPLAIKASQTNADLRLFIDACKTIETSEAAIETIEKLGIYSGITAVHPVSGESIPVWIANFVLMNYGTGAVMSVPAHDQRDFEFAHKYHIPIKQVIFSEHGDNDKCDNQAFTSKGILKNSGLFNDLLSDDANHKIIEFLEKNGKGQKKINFRLRDWGVSRQRYWGAPIPVIYCDYCGTVPVPDKDLPVILPKDVTLDGTQSPLISHPSFSYVNCPRCSTSAKRETDTFDTFMESSWYFARFASQPLHAMLDSSANDWLPVDHYIGGIEHAILHLLYARFYTKLLRDLGIVKCSEPFKKLLTQGMVLLNGTKMSKSKGNTIDPQALIDKYGADTVRLFIMFAAPPEQSLEWSADGVEGASRFLKRLWRQVYLHTLQTQGESFQINFHSLTEEQQFIRRHLHQSIQKVTHDMSVRMIFNTAIAANMELINSVSKFADESANGKAIRHEILTSIVLMLSPIVPHICDELWLMLGNKDSVMTQNWPKYDEMALIQSTIELMIQINGKLRAKISVPVSASNTEIEEIILSDLTIMKFVNQSTIKKIIIVPKKLVNIVV
mgnify:CR=1 FL=1